MTTATIIHELERLPLKDKLLVMERALRSIRIQNEKNLKHAVDILYDDYKIDKELTAFTLLDKESFYETR